MIILANEGLTNEEIAERLTTDNDKVGRRRKRFSQHGFAGIERCAPAGSYPGDRSGDRRGGRSENNA